MREILFRGKATNRDPDYYYRTDCENGDWVYGLLTETENYMGFAEMTNTDGVSRIDVDKNTIGQYTGLIDKNGNQIFEGDIVKHYCNSEDKTIFDVGEICWWENTCRFSRTSRIEGQFYNVNNTCEYEVIGNIFDNPELLKGGAD